MKKSHDMINGFFRSPDPKYIVFPSYNFQYRGSCLEYPAVFKLFFLFVFSKYLMCSVWFYTTCKLSHLIAKTCVARTCQLVYINQLF